MGWKQRYLRKVYGSRHINLHFNRSTSNGHIDKTWLASRVNYQSTKTRQVGQCGPMWANVAGSMCPLWLPIFLLQSLTELTFPTTETVCAINQSIWWYIYDWKLKKENDNASFYTTTKMEEYLANWGRGKSFITLWPDLKYQRKRERKKTLLLPNIWFGEKRKRGR